MCICRLCTVLLHTLASRLMLFMYIQQTSPICRQYQGDRPSSGSTSVYYRSVTDNNTGSYLCTLEVDKKRTATPKKVLADSTHTYPSVIFVLFPIRCINVKAKKKQVARSKTMSD